MNKTTLLRRTYLFFLQHWFLTSMICASPTLWLFLNIIMQPANAPSNQNLVYEHSPTIMWLAIVSLTILLFKSFGDSYNDKVKNNGLAVLDAMLRSVNVTASQKAQNVSSFILSNHGKRVSNPFDELVRPSEQIDLIFQNMQVTLSQLSGIHTDEIGLSIIYTTNGEDWKWLRTKNINDDLVLNILVKDQTTTAAQVISGKTHLLFFPDKRVGIMEKKYLAGRKDQAYNCVGSVLCKDLGIVDSSVPFRAILSVSTYGKQLCEFDDIDSIQRIQFLLLPTFECRLRQEVGLFFIKESMVNLKNK